LERSVSWYKQLLDLTIGREYEPADKRQRDTCLLEPSSGLEICLVQYSGGMQEPFNEFAPGLDHLEFLVAERKDLDEWAERLDSLGIAHSGVKEPPYTRNAMLTFRDPDNIQLEFFWRASG
jgi:catechol 2,3-dioxygenase-like lactoylglutathione lyase family enzyme